MMCEKVGGVGWSNLGGGRVGGPEVVDLCVDV